MARSVAEPLAVSPDGGLSVENPTGGHIVFKALAEATGGSLTAIRAEAAPGEGPPLHVHPDQDELIYTRLADETQGMKVVGPPLS